MSERFTFFYASSSPFSNWYAQAPFVKFGIRFHTNENWMMWRKGQLFGADKSLLHAILAGSPSEAKKLGKKVPNFNQAIWDVAARPLVAEGIYAKFSQNPRELDLLLKTVGTTLVEASSSDRIWGIGLSATDRRALSRTTWLGTNWLGEETTDVRDTFLKIKAAVEDQRHTVWGQPV